MLFIKSNQQTEIISFHWLIDREHDKSLLSGYASKIFLTILNNNKDKTFYWNGLITFINLIDFISYPNYKACPQKISTNNTRDLTSFTLQKVNRYGFRELSNKKCLKLNLFSRLIHQAAGSGWESLGADTTSTTWPHPRNHPRDFRFYPPLFPLQRPHVAADGKQRFAYNRLC